MWCPRIGFKITDHFILSGVFISLFKFPSCLVCEEVLPSAHHQCDDE